MAWFAGPGVSASPITWTSPQAAFAAAKRLSFFFTPSARPMESNLNFLYMQQLSMFYTEILNFINYRIDIIFNNIHIDLNNVKVYNGNQKVGDDYGK